MSQCCSLLVLCIGGVAALTAIAAVAIATNTDHWTHISVDREAVRERGAGRVGGTREVTQARLEGPDAENTCSRMPLEVEGGRRVSDRT